MIREMLRVMVPGTILGNEGVGIVEESAPSVVLFKKGDRVVVPSTICGGECSYCRVGSPRSAKRQPQDRQAGTAFFSGTKTRGPNQGLQAEFARVPLADHTLIPLPSELSDGRAILLSDIFPTGGFGADIAEIKSGDTVAGFSCGPVGGARWRSARR